MLSESIEELRGLTEVLGFFYAHPEVVRAEGRRVWKEYQRRAQLHAEVWPLQVGLRLLALDHARRVVLDPSHQVPDDLTSRSDWEHLLGMARVRHAERNDLRTVPEADLYKDHVLANLPEDPSLFGDRGMSREEVECLLVAPVEFDGYRHEPYKASDYLAGALYTEMRGFQRFRTESEWYRAAMLLLVTRAPEVTCVELGLEAELRSDGIGSRIDVRRRAESRLPHDGTGQASSGQLVQWTAAWLERIATTLERQKLVQGGRGPLTEPSSDEAPSVRHGVYIPEIIPKRAGGRGARRQVLSEGWEYMSDVVRAAKGVSRTSLHRYWDKLPATDRDYYEDSNERTVRLAALIEFVSLQRSGAK